MPRTHLALCLLSSALAFTNASGCGPSNGDSRAQTNQPPGRANAPAPPPPREESAREPGALKVLGAGGYSAVNESFVFVARDAETYAALRALQADLPALGAEHFRANAVVAAFLGQRRTGGYAVRITREGGVLRVAEGTPPKDAMLTQALTAPYQIVSVAVAEEQPLALELDRTWTERQRPYRVTTGEFTRTGGIAGREETFALSGTLRVMRHERLATLFFSLSSSDRNGARPLLLTEVASGTVAPDGQITLPRLDPGSFIPPPRPPLRAAGRFGEDEGKLTLEFESLRPKVNDGFAGRGALAAEATAAAPPKKAAAGDEPV